MSDFDKHSQHIQKAESAEAEIRQEHSAFLADLEAAAVQALATGGWEDAEICLLSYNPETKSYHT